MLNIKPAARSVLFNAGGTYIVQALAFLNAAVLGRILHPEDFGLVGMVLSVQAFLLIFATSGFSMVVIQHQDLSHKDLKSVMGLAFLVGLVLSSLMLLSAKPIAFFFHEPRLVGICQWISPIFLSTCITQVPIGILQRDMRFEALAACRVGAALISVSTAILLALKGLGYWSLVLHLILNSFSLLVFTHMCSGLGFGYRWQPKVYREILKTASHLTIFNLINFFHRNTDNILVGRRLGPEMLGFYSRAYLLLNMMNTAIGGVVAPVLHSALKRSTDPQKRIETYSDVLRGIFWSCATGMGCLAGLAPLVIHIIWGEGWESAVDPFFWLALAGMHQPVYATYGVILIVYGRTRELLLISILNTTLFVISIIWGLQDGILGVARSYSLMSHAIFMYMMFYIYVGIINGKLMSLLRILPPPLCLGWLNLLAVRFILSVTIEETSVPTGGLTPVTLIFTGLGVIILGLLNVRGIYNNLSKLIFLQRKCNGSVGMA